MVVAGVLFVTPDRPELLEWDRPEFSEPAGRRHAILTGLSRKGYWRLSKTLATQTGMTNEWLAKQGLISIRDQWMRAHGYA
jgi:hypothetical protein